MNDSRVRIAASADRSDARVSGPRPGTLPQFLLVGRSTRELPSAAGASRSCAGPSAIWFLGGQRRPDVLLRAFVAGTEGGVVHPSGRETQRAVGATAHLIRIPIVLAVVLPEADGTDFESAALIESEAPAARARMPAASDARTHDRGLKAGDVFLEPPPSALQFFVAWWLFVAHGISQDTAVPAAQREGIARRARRKAQYQTQGRAERAEQAVAVPWAHGGIAATGFVRGFVQATRVEAARQVVDRPPAHELLAGTAEQSSARSRRDGSRSAISPRAQARARFRSSVACGGVRGLPHDENHAAEHTRGISYSGRFP